MVLEAAVALRSMLTTSPLIEFVVESAINWSYPLTTALGVVMLGQSLEDVVVEMAALQGTRDGGARLVTLTIADHAITTNEPLFLCRTTPHDSSLTTLTLVSI